LRLLRRLIVLGALLSLVPSGTALAAGECGIGNRVWSGNDGTGAKILASTTNFWTFKAISTTFEIAGCGPGNNLFKKASNEAKIRYYASQNLDHLAVDMARGDGEYLDVLAHLLEMPSDHISELRSLAKKNFSILFFHDDVTSSEMLETLARVMAESDALSGYVTS
jgi:hypothetical protein